jgi:AAA15 family ATPase/GTPase
MINQLSIKGFKSIRQLDLSCRRVNVFIGEPNTGKTNILEAFAFWCPEIIGENLLSKVTRAGQAADLFLNQDITAPISITFDGETFEAIAGKDGITTQVIQKGNRNFSSFSLRNNLSLGRMATSPPRVTTIYEFAGSAVQDQDSIQRLRAPFGTNLAILLYSNKAARQSASQFFQGSGFRLNVDFTAKKLLVTKEIDDVLVSIPYTACSETLRRMVFYHLALDTNQNQILVFDEPEAHAYPPFTKRLAERIASDDRGNQFFLTTHSPYMLDSLLSKTPASDLNVVLCRMENFETKAYQLNEAQIGKLMEWSMDAFFNFDRLLDD